VGREATTWPQLLSGVVIAAAVFGLLAVIIDQRFLDRIFSWLG
jgi:hypothetical protein